MSKNKWRKDSITLRGEEIPVKVGFLPQANLKFFPENPRVYTILSAWDEKPTQKEIQELLLQRDHVKQLIQSIKANGGLTDPIFVLKDSLIVLEGNSRLAAYRALANKDAIKWGKIKCRVLPGDIARDKIFSLLGEYHIIGRQDWAPYERAGYLYRCYNAYGTSPEKMASDLGLKPSEVKHFIDVYTFMIEHNDTNVERWSYYDELLKSRKMKNTRKKFPDFDKRVVSAIKKGEIKKAVEVRDDLKKIVGAGDRIVKKFLENEKSFEKCRELARRGGADEYYFQRIKRFKTWINDSEVKKDILDVPDNLRKKIIFEFKKIQVAIKGLERRLEK